MSKTVLIVDDSIYMRMLIKQAVEKIGYTVVAEAANGASAIELALEHEPDLITLDNVMPDMFGAEVLKTFKAEGLTSEVIVISAVGQKSIIEKEKALGIAEFIVKPFTEEQLIDVITNVMQSKAA
tara:strand:+ start:330 stop:704 length:375 start_codon:yes stop_codon:yes gene_type:complete